MFQMISTSFICFILQLLVSPIGYFEAKSLAYAPSLGSTEFYLLLFKNVIKAICLDDLLVCFILQKQKITNDEDHSNKECGSSSKCNKFDAADSTEQEATRMPPIRRLSHSLNLLYIMCIIQMH